MKDWSRREQALGCAERPFHSPEIFVAEHRFQRRDVGIGAQHEDAIELGVLFRLGPINGETVVAGRGEEPTIALVADQALVALLQLPLQRRQNRGAGRGVLLHLLAIATHDVAPPGQRHGLGLIFDVLLALGQNEGNEGSGIVEDKFAHQFIRALANAKDVEKPARLQFGDRLGADHAAIGDNANPANGKALAQPVDHRDQTAGIRGVPGPHLGADRPAVAIEQHRQNHLVEIGPMVLGEAATPQRLATRALEVEAGGVHEHEIERAEQIAPPREQGLFEDVFQAARREGRGAVLLILAQFLAKPSHRAIKVMQIELLDALDPVVLPPSVRRAIGAARKQAMQNGEEHRALQREIMMARAGQVLDDFAATRLLPQSFERQRRSDPSRRTRCRRAGGEGVHDNGFGGEARARAKQALQLPALAQIFDASERCDDLLAHGLAFATAFDDLEVGAAAGGFLAEIHGAGSGSDSIGCAHDPVRCLQSQMKSTITWHYIFAKIPTQTNNINDLRGEMWSPLLKISLKEEEVNGKTYASIDAARTDIGAFLENVYNRGRLHSALGYKPPVEFEAELRQLETV